MSEKRKQQANPLRNHRYALGRTTKEPLSRCALWYQ